MKRPRFQELMFIYIDNMSRVVVTGIGLVSPLGVGAAHNFTKIIANHSGITATNKIPNLSEEERRLFEQVPSKAIGVVPEGLISEGKFTASEHFRDVRRIAKFSQYALVAAKEALEDADWVPNDSDINVQAKQLRTGVCVGSCIGSFEDVYNNAVAIHDRGYKRVSPLFVPRYLNNMAAGAIAMQYGFQGLLHSVSTACATGSSAIGDAYRFIKDGYCDVIVAGATEAVTHPLALAGFARSKSVTTAHPQDPEFASRPFDSQRSGFVLGEGSGMLVLESLEHALLRGVDKIYGEVVGYGVSSDAYHITAPSPGGVGAARAMKSALKNASLLEDVGKIDYINAHATSTKLGDQAENLAIKSIFEAQKDHLVVSSNKGSIGHLLSAAGAVESGLTLLAMKNGIVPPTLNLTDPGDADGGPEYNNDYIFNYAANKAVHKDIYYAMNNSFGFGGVNVSLVFKKY